MAGRRTGVEALDRFGHGNPADVAVLEAALLESDEVDRVTHGFHTYPAGLHPNAARGLIGRWGGPRVLDPFCGGGTTMVEARLAGHQAIGRDVSPIALRVARARTASPDDATLTKLRSASRKLTEAARHATTDPDERTLYAVESWYAPYVIHEIESIRAGIAEADPAVSDWLYTALSSILIKVSWRASDTSARREKHRRPPGTAAVLFHKKVRELARRMVSLREGIPEGTPPADIGTSDARKVDLPEPVDLIVTSPPYPSTYDYLALQHLRQLWLPDVMPSFDLEIGSRRSFKGGERSARTSWREDTVAWMTRASALLNPGGHLVIVIGDGLTPQGHVDTAAPTEEIASDVGLTYVARASVGRPDHARNQARWEHAYTFRK